MKYIVEGQKLRPYQKDQRMADGSVEFVDIEFQFSSEWDGMESLVAQFTQNGKTYNQVITDGKCKLPAEIQDGPLTLSVFGYRGATRGTTTKLPEMVCDSGFVSDGETPIPPTPDLYAQLLAQIKDLALGGPPYIGENDNWFVWDFELDQYVDSGVSALGKDGKPGPQGEPGKSAYQSAVDGGYTGTEEEFNTDIAGISTLDLLHAMQETGIIEPVADSDGMPFLDGEGNIFIL